MTLRSIVGWGLSLALTLAVATPALAQEEESESADAPYGLGPLEFAPLPLVGNVGAPRSAVPETRFGVGLHWMMASEGTPAGDTSMHLLGLLLEAHLELLGVLEVGVDVEALRYMARSSPAGDDSSTEFGFITPRVKFAFLNYDMFTMSFGLGVALPTGSGEQFDAVTPIGLDPGLFAAFRLLDMISINVSLPFPVWISIPDEGDTTTRALFTPQAGVTVMPIDYIGGFVDLQLQILFNPETPTDPTEPTPDKFQLMNVIIGARSNFLPWMMGEIGAIIPVAGDLADTQDFGLGIRIVATPDFL
jgi:hypothetical protein